MDTNPVKEAASPETPAPIEGPPARKWLGLPKLWVLGLLGLALALLLPGLLWYRAKHPAEATFRTVAVVVADITQVVTATGTLQPVVTSPVGAQVSGIVWKLHADFNSQVKAGELLVELDPALFNNAVAQASAALSQAQANETSALATVKGARVIRDRTLSLASQSLVSKADLDAATATFGQTDWMAKAGAAQVGQARKQLDRAQLDLQHSIIRSPVDGTVISRNIDVGQAVAATLTAPTLFTIAQDLHHMQVHAAVDEADIGVVHAGQKATFTVDAFRGQTFQAVVNEVRNAPVTTQNVVTYDVLLDVENPQGTLRPGMTANVLVFIVQKKQVLALSNEALRFRPAGGKAPGAKVPAGTKAADGLLEASVFVPQGGLAVRVPIRTGVTDGNLTEVAGLEVGRAVIIDMVSTKAKSPASRGSGRGL